MLRTLSDRNRQLLASFLGTLLLVMLLLLAAVSSEFVGEPPPEITTHEVQTYLPPPPPPPPMKQQDTSSSPRPSLARAKVENPVELEVMDLEADIGAGSISGFGTGGLGDGLGSGSGGWGIVGFFELDNIPMVRSAGIMSYPEEAEDQGILEFEVEIHIILDEKGRTYPVRIMKNPFPSMNQEIMKYASTVVFTPPTKMGAPVRTEYLWPLLMKKL